MNADMKHCIMMIEAEEQRARAAPTDEAAEMHHQMVMLYRAQLNRLCRRSPIAGVDRPSNPSLINW